MNRGDSRGKIRKAYVQSARDNHPDKGGDADKTAAINRAWDVLGDKHKRQQYDDNDGIAEGLNFNEDSGPTPEQAAEMAEEAAKAAAAANKPFTTLTVPVTLEEAFLGTSKIMSITRTLMDPSKTPKQCGVCEGKGESCQNCNGRGVFLKEADWETVVWKQVTEDIEIKIPRGCASGDTQRITNKGSQITLNPTMDDGRFNVKWSEAASVFPDLEVKFFVQQHDAFWVEGSDLVMSKEISFAQALTGFDFNVVDLSGNKLLVQIPQGQIDPFNVQFTNNNYSIKGRGMFNQKTKQDGDLKINFKVTVPKEFTEDMVEAAKTIGGGNQMEEEVDLEATPVQLEPICEFGVGDYVTIVGLTSKSGRKLNGKLGTIKDDQDLKTTGRLEVLVSGGIGIKKLKPSNLERPRKFQENQTVEIHGLTKSKDLNHFQGVIASYDKEAQRYVVYVKALHQVKKFREANLRTPPMVPRRNRDGAPIRSYYDKMILPPGTPVMMTLLGTESLNGRSGVVLGYDRQKERYKVYVAGNKVSSFKPLNCIEMKMQQFDHVY